MKRLIAFCFVSCLILTACAPSQAAIQLALAQTQTAAPTNTPVPTNTPLPPEPTAALAVTPSLSPEQISAQWTTFEQTITSLITSVDGVRVVHFARLEDGVIHIDLQTKWQAASGQLQVAYDVIERLSGFCTNTMETQIAAFTGVTDPPILITTQSVDELYVFESKTTFQQCVTVGFGDLNFVDWQKEAITKQVK
jgi:hypothetical protein